MTIRTPAGEAFDGVIGRTFAESTPWWPAAKYQAAAPNVVIVVLDDTGFSHLGCYGSTLETPNIDALAAGGLRYTGFHTTALCSPTRACLLTGRNHHAVGMRAISNFDTGFPNMRGAIPRSAATLAEIGSAEEIPREIARYLREHNLPAMLRIGAAARLADLVEIHVRESIP